MDNIEIYFSSCVGIPADTVVEEISLRTRSPRIKGRVFRKTPPPACHLWSSSTLCERGELCVGPYRLQHAPSLFFVYAQGEGFPCLKQDMQRPDETERPSLNRSMVPWTQALQPGRWERNKPHSAVLIVACCALLFPSCACPSAAAAEEGGPRYSPVPSLLKALAANPSQPTPLRLLLQTHLRSGDHAACADDFWKHWAKMRGHRPSPGTGGKPPQSEGAGPEGFGDGWAWDAWRGGDVIAAAEVVNVAAVCFAELGRFVG